MAENQEDWEYVTYQLLQIQICDGWQYVCAEDGCLVAYPLAGLALAKVTTYRHRGERGRQFVVVGKPIETTEIVGIEFLGGYADVVNGLDNFAGICRVGEDIRLAVDCLKVEYLRSLRPEFRRENVDNV